MTHRLHTLLTGGDFFEGPRWRRGRWWVSDFYRQAVYTVTPNGESEKVLDVPEQPSGLGWMPDGSLLVVSMRDRRLLRQWPDGQVTTHADLAEHAPWHCNDMVVDGHGRAWVGNFGFDMMSGADPVTTCLLRVDPDGSVTEVADGLAFPNGMVISPDGRALVVCESMAGRLTEFTIGQDGALSDRRVHAQLGKAPPLTTAKETTAGLTVAPDGCCLDAREHIWVADARGGGCMRVVPGGEIAETIEPPEGQSFFACMLGGPEGRTLLLCSAPDSSERRRKGTGEASLLTCEVDTPHAGYP